MKTEESMKKIREMMVVFVGIFCMTGCGNTEESFPSATGIVQEEATKTTQETEIQEETGVVKEDKAQQEDAAEMMNPAVLTGGALPFTNMTICSKHQSSGCQLLLRRHDGGRLCQCDQLFLCQYQRGWRVVRGLRLACSHRSVPLRGRKCYC